MLLHYVQWIPPCLLAPDPACVPQARIVVNAALVETVPGPSKYSSAAEELSAAVLPFTVPSHPCPPLNMARK